MSTHPQLVGRLTVDDYGKVRPPSSHFSSLSLPHDEYISNRESQDTEQR